MAEASLRTSLTLDIMAGPETSRTDYPHISTLQTRWADNDVYGHVNNVAYYGYFDTIVNDYLISQGALDIHDGAVIGLVVETGCRYFAPLAFPQKLEGGLRVSRIGKSSVKYELAIFAEGENPPAAEGFFVHVYVDRESRRPVAGLPDPLRAALQRLHAD
jgi:acyl-CoA thioester hydrolase